MYIAVRAFSGVESLGMTPPIADTYRTLDIGFLTSSELQPPATLQVVQADQIICPFIKTDVIMGG